MIETAADAVGDEPQITSKCPTRTNERAELKIIFDSSITQKKPASAEAETGSSPLKRPLLQVIKVVSQELVKAKRFQQSPYEAQRT
ncbi:hypothetical protein [Pseudomonas atacamensis]|uniref:hypothetical protein n=1 Tax=Pseudomonas atacamensis TaxID=2565368 RepID=UPI0037FB39A1